MKSHFHLDSDDAAVGRSFSHIAIKFFAFTIFTILIAVSPVAGAGFDPAPYDAAFVAGDTQVIWDHASPELRKLFGSPEKLKSFRQNALGDHPTPRTVETSTEPNDVVTLARVVTNSAGRNLKVTFTVSTVTGQILGLLVEPTSADALSPLLSDAEIIKTLGKCVDTDHLAPGIVAAIVDANGSRVLSYGHREVGKPGGVDGDSLFEIGSVTKVFTTILLQRMADHGDVNLNDPISRYLPSDVKAPARDGRGITLISLATHTSALPRSPTNMPATDGDDPWGDYTLPLLYNFLSTYSLPRGVGSRYEYSNIRVGLLGHLLGVAGHSDYESLVIQNICRPLHMNSTRITLNPELQSHVARGHSAFGPVVKNWSSQALLADGALFSSGNDMLKFLSANMNSASTALSAAMQKSHNPLHPAGLHTQIALGWHITTLPRSNAIIWHNGATGGYRSYIGFDLKSHRGVVILSNSANDVDGLGLYFLGQSPTYMPPQIPTQRTPIPLPGATLDLYAGHYKTGVLDLTVVRENDHLVIQQIHQPRFQILPESESGFFYTAFDGQVTFQKSPDGVVRSLTIHAGKDNQSADRL